MHRLRPLALLWVCGAVIATPGPLAAAGTGQIEERSLSRPEGGIGAHTSAPPCQYRRLPARGTDWAMVGQTRVDRPAPLVQAQLLKRAKPDYEGAVCTNFELKLPKDAKRGTSISFSNPGVASGQFDPFFPIVYFHCDHPGTTRATVRYVDAGGGKRTVHKSIRCK
jgi:hypothetical protein